VDLYLTPEQTEQLYRASKNFKRRTIVFEAADIVVKFLVQAAASPAVMNRSSSRLRVRHAVGQGMSGSKVGG